MDRPDRLVDKEDYFIMIDDNDMVLVKRSNRRLSKELKSYGIPLKPFLKKNDLNIKNENDFFEALSYIDKNIEPKIKILKTL